MVNGMGAYVYGSSLFTRIVTGAWIVFVLYWIVSARNVKRDIGGRTRRSMSLLRIILAIALTSLFPTVIVRILGLSIRSNRDAAMRTAGVILTISGILFAIWARRHLGRNWSSHPALKEDHELVTTGPYAFVRHPIYTGMLTASLGSILGTVQAFWLYYFIIMGIAFIYRIHIEEGIMMSTFPDDYPAYRSRTKALIPFIW